MKNTTIEIQGVQKLNDNKQKTPIITGLYILLTIIFIILCVSTLTFFYLTLFGVIFIIDSIYKATKFKNGAAIKSGMIGQAIIFFFLVTFFSALPSADPYVNVLGYSVITYICLIICLLEIFIIYPLLYMYRKEEKIIQQEKTARFQIIGNIKQYLYEKKIARQENKQKTPIITGFYALLTVIIIIWSVVLIALYYFSFIGILFIIYSIYLTVKYKHGSAIISGIIGQVIIVIWLGLLLGYLPSADPLHINITAYYITTLFYLIICLLEIFVIYPLLFMYRNEEKWIQRMTRDQAIAYIKDISNYNDSIILDDISTKTDWKGEELTSLIETLIFNGELTAEIRNNRLLFDREALLAVSEASEVTETELEDTTSEESEMDEEEADIASKEILPIKNKKGKTLKNVVSVDDIEKVLSVEELQELQQTEAEIGIEEMRINCIVHKGPVEGTNVYICPSCKTFYCVRCAKAVKKSGDQCWTCKSELTL